MSKLSAFSKKSTAQENAARVTAVENFMGGTSFKLNPIDTLKIVASSGIFGEMQYYRESGVSTRFKTVKKLGIFSQLFNNTDTAIDMFTASIDAALNYNFAATLELARTLRSDYNMRLNPAVIYVRAIMHEGRVKFNEENPGLMKSIGKEIASRPDDLTNQFDYWMFVKGSKQGMPSILKRTWADRLAEYSRYQLNKYKGKSLIDLVRISHASGETIDELMKTGTIKVSADEQTWETLRASGKSWSEILETIKIPHMALLRNLRGIFTEINDLNRVKEVAQQLKDGVLGGKQFPFRYWSAYNAVNSADSVNHRSLLLDTLEECIDIAITNSPKIKGKVACLSDNSGSAWGTLNSEYGSVHVAEIANLSSLITAMQAEEGYVGVFGDRLSLNGVSKRNGLLTQLKETCRRGKAQGGSTENGIWLFWDEAIKNKIHYDTVFIYSDMQAGHGGLYGSNHNEYSNYISPGTHHNIDVLKLVDVYRKQVNPKVNVFSVQVAGYDNTVLPESLYRGAILSGWTGRESQYAAAIIDAWDSVEN